MRTGKTRKIASAAGIAYLSLTFRRDPAADVLYTVQVSQTLTNWLDGSTYSPVGDFPDTLLTTEIGRVRTGVETITVRDNMPLGNATARFLRLKITGP